MTSRLLSLSATVALAGAVRADDLPAPRPEKKHLAALCRQLRAPDVKKQVGAARDVERLGPLAGAAVPDLLAALQTPSAKLRLAILSALSAVGPGADDAAAAAAVSRLRPLMRDRKEDEQIRAFAVEALGGLGDRARGVERAAQETETGADCAWGAAVVARKRVAPRSKQVVPPCARITPCLPIIPKKPCSWLFWWWVRSVASPGFSWDFEQRPVQNPSEFGPWQRS